MARRGSYLAVARGRADVVYADAGGAAGGTSDYQRVKFEAILAGEMKMGLAAHNVGRAEAALGPAALREIKSRLGVPLVSSNVRDASGTPVADPAVVVDAGAGRRIAVTGVLSPTFATPQLRVDEPRQSVLDAIAPLKGRYDALVVLAYLPRDELEQLAAALPEADAVVGGPTGQPMAPTKLGPTTVASSTNKGKFLVEFAADSVPKAPGAGAWDAKVVEVAASLADEEAQLAVVRDYLAELARRDFAASETGLVAPLPAGIPADYRVAGTSSCTECHREDHAVWHGSKHAHAWETLRAKGFDADPYCMQCHTTGYGLPGGFESRTRSTALIDVGCENCHGPSQAHVLRPEVRTTFAAADQCVRCHDQENSPKFEYKTYWERIRHPRSPTTTTESTKATAGVTAD